MKGLPLVSVIIVNFNGKTHLEKCLNSLNKVNYEKFEIILVDNNSTDNSVEFVQKNFTSIKIIKLDKNYGFAKPNNVGAKNAKGEFLLFLNNDTVVTPNFIIEMIKVVKQNPEIAICQSLLLKPNDNGVDSAGDFVDIFGRAYGSRTLPSNVDYILSARGASMLVIKEIFWKLRGFDDKFFVSFEDVDLGWKAWISGYKVVIVPKSVVYHLGGKTVSKMKEEIQFHGSKNTLVLRLTNFETRYVVRSIFVLFFVTFFRRFFKISMIPDPEEPPPLPSVRIMTKALSWVLKNWSYISEKRHFINSNRKLSTKELMELGLITRV